MSSLKNITPDAPAGTLAQIVNRVTVGTVIRHAANGYTFIRVDGKSRKIKTFNLYVPQVGVWGYKG